MYIVRLCLTQCLRSTRCCHVHREGAQLQLSPSHPSARGLARERKGQEAHDRQSDRLAAGQARRPSTGARRRGGTIARRAAATPSPVARACGPSGCAGHHRACSALASPPFLRTVSHDRRTVRSADSTSNGARRAFLAARFSASSVPTGIPTAVPLYLPRIPLRWRADRAPAGDPRHERAPPRAAPPAGRHRASGAHHDPSTTRLDHRAAMSPS